MAETQLLQQYLSLHADAPGEDGANEVIGGGYARQPVTWDENSGEGKGIGNENGDVVFRDMPSTEIHWVGFWDAPVGGKFIRGFVLPIWRLCFSPCLVRLGPFSRVVSDG